MPAKARFSNIGSRCLGRKGFAPSGPLESVRLRPNGLRHRRWSALGFGAAPRLPASRALTDEACGAVINGRTVAHGLPDGWAELAVGGLLDLSDDRVLFLDGTWRTGLGAEAA